MGHGDEIFGPTAPSPPTYPTEIRLFDGGRFLLGSTVNEVATLGVVITTG